MKHLEIVELRSTSHRQDAIKQALADTLTTLQNSPGRQSIKILRHSEVETDLAVHILHEGEELLVGGSALGLHLRSFLSRFGLVNHNLWTEVEAIETDNGAESE